MEGAAKFAMLVDGLREQALQKVADAAVSRSNMVRLEDLVAHPPVKRTGRGKVR